MSLEPATLRPLVATKGGADPSSWSFSAAIGTGWTSWPIPDQAVRTAWLALGAPPFQRTVTLFLAFLVPGFREVTLKVVMTLPPFLNPSLILTVFCGVTTEVATVKVRVAGV